MIDSDKDALIRELIYTGSASGTIVIPLSRKQRNMNPPTRCPGGVDEDVDECNEEDNEWDYYPRTEMKYTF